MLRPVDLQTIFPRSLDVQKVQEIRSNRPIADHQEFSRELVQQTQIQRGKVQKSDPSAEEDKINDDHQNDKKRQSKYKRFAEPSKKQETEEKSNDPERGQHIDFKV